MTDEERFRLLAVVVVRLASAIVQVRGMVLDLSQNKSEELQDDFVKSVSTITAILSDADQLIQELSERG